MRRGTIWVHGLRHLAIWMLPISRAALLQSQQQGQPVNWRRLKTVVFIKLFLLYTS